MDSRKVIGFFISVIFIFGISGTAKLVYNEFSQGSICPTLLGIPACYIIALCLVIPFISHLLKWRNAIYFLGTGIAFSIAFYGTVSQTMGLTECPKTASGTPMCYISLAIFTSLIVLKFIQIKLHSPSTPSL